MTPIDSTNDRNIQLFKATFTHYQSSCASKKKTLTCLIFTVILETFPKLGG